MESTGERILKIGQHLIKLGLQARCGFINLV